MIKVEVVVLANSVKHMQHCVAGKCLETGRWIRPVSNEQGAELTDAQIKIQNPHGTFDVKPLQKISMGFSKHVPLINQPENYLIDGNLWQQNYVIGVDKLRDYLDNPTDLWGDGCKVLYDDIVLAPHNIVQSLYLVQVEGLKLYKTDQGRRRIGFTYKNVYYDLAATDPDFGKIVKEQRKVNGILCVSLGEEYQGYCYKLVATIF